jgi:hypothetical protein
MILRSQSISWLCSLTLMSTLASLMWNAPAASDPPCTGESQPPETVGAIEEDEAAGPDAIEFYIDGKKVPEADVKADSRDRVFAVFGSKGDPTDRILRLHHFSSDERKLEFADAEGIPLRRCQDSEAHLAQYAESSGAIRAFEETGVVPEAFTRYSALYTAQMFPESARGPGSAALAFGHYGRDFVGGSSFPLTGQTPAFVGAWNNAVSRYFVFFSTGIVYGYVTLFDKAFYRDRYYQSWNWNHNTVYFIGSLSWANDRAGSALAF